MHALEIEVCNYFDKQNYADEEDKEINRPLF